MKERLSHSDNKLNFYVKPQIFFVWINFLLNELVAEIKRVLDLKNHFSSEIRKISAPNIKIRNTIY